MGDKVKSFDSRTYSVNDFLEWYNNGQLEFNPFFQRRPVWSSSAKSFLMDTIIRGKPIPKVFIRQKMEPKTKKSVREVVDGQQRLRAIISFLNDGFSINVKHNKEYGGIKYSQLSRIDESIQSQLLNYEISTDLLVDMSDADVLDVFGRLNSYAVVLNEQEKINASHFGPFKVIASRIGHSFVNFYKNNKILSPNSIIRMGEVALTSELLISMLEGTQDKKTLKSYYGKYEKNFPFDSEDIEIKFTRTMQEIQKIFGSEGIALTEFNRYHMFYSLFGAIYHILYSMPGEKTNISNVDLNQPAVIREVIENIDNLLQEESSRNLSVDDAKFYDASAAATTVKAMREERVRYILRKINEAFGDSGF